MTRLEEMAATAPPPPPPPPQRRFLPNNNGGSSYRERAARDRLELSLVDNAEIVFATLSATGRCGRHVESMGYGDNNL